MNNAKYLQSRKSPKGSQKILLGSRPAITLSAVDYVTPSCILLSSSHLSPMQTVQHCWSTTPNIVGCCMLRPFAQPVVLLLRVVGSCCAKFETNISFFFPVIAERCATMLDLFAQLFPTLLGPRTPITQKSNGLYPSHDAP